MTCVVGLTDEAGNLWVGADSASVGGYSIRVRADEKVFANGPFLIGIAGSWRMGQVLRYRFVPPVQELGEDTERFMVTRFMEAIRTEFNDAGLGRVRENVQTMGDGAFIVGYRSRLFIADWDYHVGWSSDGMAAVGCGERIAYGSLFSTEGQDPEHRVRTALAAAEAFSAGVRGPFVVRHVPVLARKPVAEGVP